jgi:hypothetical protein
MRWSAGRWSAAAQIPDAYTFNLTPLHAGGDISKDKVAAEAKAVAVAAAAAAAAAAADVCHGGCSAEWLSDDLNISVSDVRQLQYCTDWSVAGKATSVHRDGQERYGLLLRQPVGPQRVL